MYHISWQHDDQQANLASTQTRELVFVFSGLFWNAQMKDRMHCIGCFSLVSKTNTISPGFDLCEYGKAFLKQRDFFLCVESLHRF